MATKKSTKQEKPDIQEESSDFVQTLQKLDHEYWVLRNRRDALLSIVSELQAEMKAKEREINDFLEISSRVTK